MKTPVSKWLLTKGYHAERLKHKTKLECGTRSKGYGAKHRSVVDTQMKEGELR
jgi:hypothetical protein